VPAEPDLRRLWRVVAAIPSGRVLSYAEVARRSRLPGGPRQVARALRLAPLDLQLPWHRVVNSRGRPGLPAGSPEHAEQLARLRAEGFDVARPLPLGDGQGPVTTLDEWLWGPG
jgi:methylated-DNA-protein-cysteine methyltransferase-like protein